jgi:hypothetical protein
MASRSFSTVRQGSAFYINVATTSASDSYTATGAAADFAAAAGNAGQVLVRDMGKTVRIASQGATAHVANASVALVLRKVQLVRDASVMGSANVPLNSFVGLNDGVLADPYGVFYIQLSPVGKWARLSL